VPRRFRDRLRSKSVKMIMREDGVIELHPVQDPLKLKGSVKLPFTVEELKEAGDRFAERAEG